MWECAVRPPRWVALLPAPLLALSLLPALGGPGRGPVLPTVGLAVMAACWTAAMVLFLGARPLLGAMSLPGRWARIGYFVALLALLTGLVAWSPWFMVVSWVACVYPFALFEARWAFFAAAAAGVALTAAQARSLAPSSPALVSLLAPVVAGGWYLGRESDVRRRLIGRLAEANTRLADAAAANAELRDQLLEQARVTGMEQERRRMAREIHDTVAQDLTAVVAQLELALVTPAAGAWREPVRQARDQAREGLSEARRSLRALTPGPLDGVGLPEAIERLAYRWQQRTATEVSCEIDDDLPDLAGSAQAALLRVTQAALANVAEHAHASRVRVTLSGVDDAVLLDVWDDGAGFDPEAVAVGEGDRGFGLAGMRQRLEGAGGRLTIESSPGSGTAVCAVVPAGTSR